MRFARAILDHPDTKWSHLDMIFIDKTRIEAGRVKDAKVEKILRLSRNVDTSEIELKELEGGGPTFDNPCFDLCISAGLDDIIDQGGTSERNDDASRRLYPNKAYSVRCFTHGIASGGTLMAVKRAAAEHVLIGRTHIPNDFSRSIAGLETVDLSCVFVDRVMGR